MKKTNAIIFLFLLATIFVLHASVSFSANNKLLNKTIKNTQGVSFTENKGQVHDQNNKARPDVLFGGTDGNLVFHLKNNGISYQLSKINSWKEVEVEHTKIKRKQIDKSTIYRLDIEWLNANSTAKLIKGKAFEGFDNYYFENCPNGALNVKSFEDVTYQNIYNGIDLKWYQKDGHLKYDYLVAAGANYKTIQLKFSGAKTIKLNDKGELVITTPLGNIIEQAPFVVQNNKTLIAKWVIANNTVGFDIENLDATKSFVIDPAVRAWGTYYGGATYDIGTSSSTDASNNVYLSGNSEANSGTVIATSGSHQSILGGNRDAYLVKFNSGGIRQWGTYYGGVGFDLANSCATDASGNIYMLGITQSSVGTTIASAGSHQSTYGGGAASSADAFLVKFNSNGIRQWGTYYGGIGTESGNSCSLDASGNVYITGITSAATSSNAITTVGSHQSTYGGDTYDAFLVKFAANGVRQWGTYYGGSGIDYGQTCCVDASGFIYLGGYTASNSGTAIATPGSHQPSHGGNTYDAFLVKFNITGVRQWGTYYGGTGYDDGYSCSIDASGNIYLSGSTTSNSGTIIASAGSHQATFGGGSSADAYVVKFNASGVRQWGTYYGGSDIGDDRGYSCTTDANGNIFLTGKTTCSNSSIIATPGSHQTIFGGGITDAFLVKFNTAGVRQWGTYYGGSSGYDEGQTCCLDAIGSIYLGGFGQSNSGTVIATPGSHQSTYGGGAYDAFLVKFSDCSVPTNPIGSNQSVCSNNSATLTATSGTVAINWFATPTSTNVLGTGTAYITPTLGIGSYTYYAEAFTCVPSVTRTAITLTVNSNPTITVNSGIICSGQSFSINPSGANTYTFQGGNPIVSPTANTSYTMAGTSTQGCVSSNIAVSSVTVNTTPTISVNSGSICSGNSFTINPTGANTYTISGGSAIVSPTINTLYNVTGTSAQGCVSSNTAISSVTVNAIPVVSVNSGSICSGNSFTISPTGASTYTISGGSAIVSPTTNTSYNITGTSAQGCASSNTAVSSVTVNTLPNVTAITNNTLLCTGQTASLTASGASTYLWNTSATTSVIAISPTVTTNYTVTGTSANSCSNTVVITQSVSACTGIVKLNEAASLISIYPNPSNGVFTISGIEQNASISIYNAIGELVKSIKSTNNNTTFDLSEYSNGIYFIKIKTNIGESIQKIIKQ